MKRIVNDKRLFQATMILSAQWSETQCKNSWLTKRVIKLIKPELARLCKRIAKRFGLPATQNVIEQSINNWLAIVAVASAKRQAISMATSTKAMMNACGRTWEARLQLQWTRVPCAIIPTERLPERTTAGANCMNSKIDLVYKAIKNLPELQRKAVNLMLEGSSMQYIAYALGREEWQVRGLLAHALTSLREMFGTKRLRYAAPKSRLRKTTANLSLEACDSMTQVGRHRSN